MHERQKSAALNLTKDTFRVNRNRANSPRDPQIHWISFRTNKQAEILFSKYSREGVLQVGLQERIPQVCKLRGNHPLADEKQGVRHFSQRQTQRERRCGE